MFNSGILSKRNYINHDAVQKIPPIRQQKRQMSSLAPPTPTKHTNDKNTWICLCIYAYLTIKLKYIISTETRNNFKWIVLHFALVCLFDCVIGIASWFTTPMFFYISPNFHFFFAFNQHLVCDSPCSWLVWLMAYSDWKKKSLWAKLMGKNTSGASASAKVDEH